MVKSMFLLCLLLVVGEIVLGEDVPTKKPKGRQPRNFDGGFADFSTYYKQDESKEQPEKPVYTDAGSRPSNPPQRSEPFGDFKAYSKDKFYYPGNIPIVFKGYPYYSKGQPASDPEQPMMDMMSMMDMMKKLQDGDSGKEPSFLQKLASDPKTILAAALIPVSIMLASFVPLIVNYFMSGSSSVPSIISTLASGSAGRSLKESDFLRTLLRGIDRYGRSLESRRCLEEAVCQFATDPSHNGELDNVKLAARSLSKILKTEWVGDGRFATLLAGIRRKDCSNVCEKSKAQKKKGNFSE